MVSDNLLLLIGGFVGIAVLVVLGIILFFSWKKRKLLKEIPSGDLREINYDPSEVKKKQDEERYSKIIREVNDDAKKSNREEDDKGGLREQDSGPDNGGGGIEEPDARADVPSKPDRVQKGSSNLPKQDSSKYPGFKPSWKGG